MSGMSDMGDDIHELVHAFADGELEPAEAESFRGHLATCEQCQVELQDILELGAVSAQLAATEKKASPAGEEAARPAEAARPVEAPRSSPAASRAFRPTWSRRRVGLTVVMGGVLAAAFALAVLRSPGDGSGGGDYETLALAPTRSMEARLSYPGASGWRPYGVKRSGSERTVEVVPLETQVKLEKAGDVHGLATTFLMRGERDRAFSYLGKLSTSPEVDSDRAVVALSKGELEQALTLLEGVLAKAPRHAPALWNRGLVLRELGLELVAAESFGQVAALNEPGWSDEAREHKASLERQGLERLNRWKAVRDAGKAMVEQGTPLSDAQVRDAPSVARRSLYLAVGSAPGAERVRALLPVAKALDAHYGGDVLRTYVERNAQRDFSQAATHEAGDAWFLMEAELRRAQAQLAGGESAQAEATLSAALSECEQQRLDSRCAELEQVLAGLYAAGNRLPEAREHALRGLRQARRINDADLEVRLLEDLGEIARLGGNAALSRAYLQESALRQPAH
ncbi:zf-HC2 domain-containing protein [Hyalangium gracile]|uniref:zf-HC2 domain-containing protein n=1 Tax=Hyalangium gracile TaxID=394092 RepID=UPI001CCE229A|nr:zf-HC2 domain-containing protein [Hyalangium gracile]